MTAQNVEPRLSSKSLLTDPSLDSHPGDCRINALNRNS